MGTVRQPLPVNKSNKTKWNNWKKPASSPKPRSIKRNKNPRRKSLKNKLQKGGWGGSRTVNYDVNQKRRSSSQTIKKYFKKYFH